MMRMRKPHRSRAAGRGSSCASACLLFLILFACAPAFAVAEFGYDVRLLHELIAIQMFDYAGHQLNQMLARYPDKKEAVLIEQARFFLLTGKPTQADAALKQIPANSPYAERAVLLQAEMASRKSDWPTAKKIYADYFAKHPAPASAAAEDGDAFRELVGMYVGVLKQSDDPTGAAKALELLKAIKGENSMSDRELKFLNGQTMLDTIEKAVDEGKPVDTAAVQAAIKILEGIQWGGHDALTGVALVEAGRGYNLLKQYDKAIVSITSVTDIIVDIDNFLRGKGESNASPVAAAQLYYGMAQVGQAQVEKAKNNEAAQKNMLEALQRFKLVQKKYPKSPYAPKANLQLSRALTILDKDFGLKIKDESASAATVAALLQEADNWLKNKKYDEALPLCLKATRLARGGDSFPAAAARLMECYAYLGRNLETEAIASYLAERYAGESDAAEALMRTGAMVLKNSETIKAKDAHETAVSLAMRLFERFVTLAPTHPKAADIGFTVAENEYRIANELADATRTMPDGDDKEKLKAKARAQYMIAAPKYKRMIELFPSWDKGIRSYYKLGWCHDFADHPKEAAEAFLAYVDNEKSADKNDDRLEAKFRAGEQLLLGGEPADAVSHLTELLAWYDGNDKQLNTKTERAVRIQEDAASYLGWGYDLEAETYRPKLEEIEDRLAAAMAELQKTETQRQRAEKDAADAAAESAKAEKDFQDAEKSLAAPATTGEGGKSAGEVKVTAEQDADLEKQRQQANLKQAKDQLAGEALEYKTQLAVLGEARKSTGERQARLKERLAALEQLALALKKEEKPKADTLDAQTKRFKAAQAAHLAVDLEVQKLEAALAEVKKTQQESTDPAKLKEAGAERGRIAVALEQAQNRFKQTLAALKTVTTPAAEKARQELTDTLNTLRGKIAANDALVSDLRRTTAMADLTAAVQDATLAAVSNGLARNDAAQKLLARKKNVSEALADPELRKRVQTEIEALRSVKTKRLEKATFVQENAKKESAVQMQATAALKEKIKGIEGERTPVQAQIDELKHKAEVQFRAFLAKYPASKQAPDCLARLGSILLEFKKYDEAAKLFNELNSKFPNAKAGKTALFNLGRAQCEVNQPDQAAVVFEKIVRQPEQQPAANLNYIVDKMLAGGHPEIALKAVTELLARADSKPEADTKLISDSMRESLLFRAASAAAGAKNGPMALDYLAKLFKFKENTGYYFDAKFLSAQIRRNLPQPDYTRAVTDLNEILQNSTDSLVSTRAYSELGDTYDAMGGETNLRIAAARFLSAVETADSGKEEDLPLLDHALFKGAVLFARLGENDLRDRMVKKYQQLFPKGEHAVEITHLPAPEFKATGTPPAPGAE